MKLTSDEQRMLFGFILLALIAGITLAVAVGRVEEATQLRADATVDYAEYVGWRVCTVRLQPERKRHN